MNAMLEHAVASASDGARAATADELLGLDAPLDFLRLLRCRFRFQIGTGRPREIKALRELSPAAFSVSIETGSTFFRFQLGLIDRLIDRTMSACRVSSTTQTTRVGLKPNAETFFHAAC